MLWKMPPLGAPALVKCRFGHLRGVFIKPMQCSDGSGFHARLQMPVACLTRAVQDRVGQSGTSTELVEGHRRKPLRAPNLSYVVTFRVHQTFVGHNLAINAAKRMIAAVRHTHHDVPFAADAEIGVANYEARSITAPPMPQVVRLRPGFEQEIGATSEDASGFGS
jgi:hypothetical protein